MNHVVLIAFKCVIYVFTFIYSIGFCLWLGFYTLMHPRQKYWQKKKREKPPQSLVDLSWGLHGFAQLQDIRLHYVEKGDRTKPLILFIHGFPEFWYSWRHQLAEFSKDYWTVAVDMRGYGESEKPTKLCNYKMIKLIEDIKQLVLYLGREKFIAVGHDWGGLILWNFLDFYPDMVEKFVVMNCPHHKSWTTALIVKPKQFIMSWYSFFFQMPYLPEIGLSMNDFRKFEIEMMHENSNKSISEEDLEAYKYTFSKPGALTYAVNYYRANCGELYIRDSPKVYPEGLLIFAENDNYLGTHFVPTAKRSIANLQTYIVKDANHFVQQDNPLEVNIVIRAFLQGTQINEEHKLEKYTYSQVVDV